MFDPRFICPACGCAPELPSDEWRAIEQYRKGQLPAGKSYTCRYGHVWTAPLTWTPAMGTQIVRVATPEELDFLKTIGIS